MRRHQRPRYAPEEVRGGGSSCLDPDRPTTAVDGRTGPTTGRRERACGSRPVDGPARPPLWRAWTAEAEHRPSVGTGDDDWPPCYRPGAERARRRPRRPQARQPTTPRLGRGGDVTAGSRPRRAAPASGAPEKLHDLDGLPLGGGEAACQTRGRWAVYTPKGPAREGEHCKALPPRQTLRSQPLTRGKSVRPSPASARLRTARPTP